MLQGRRLSPLSFDLGRGHRRSEVTLFSNLVTRPTGRAIRTGVESQIAEMDGAREACLSILDFSQVKILDYSCADEIVAKLLLRFLSEERPAEAFFVARGVQEHHVDAIEAVLERHSLLLVVQDDAGEVRLLGEVNPVSRVTWEALLKRGRARAEDIAPETGLSEEAVAATLTGFTVLRVAVPHPDGTYSPLSSLLEG